MILCHSHTHLLFAGEVLLPPGVGVLQLLVLQLGAVQGLGEPPDLQLQLAALLLQLQLAPALLLQLLQLPAQLLLLMQMLLLAFVQSFNLGSKLLSDSEQFLQNIS